MRIVPKDIVAVMISGMKSSYPPDISAMRKIAVIGACITPAISPAMPTRTKFCSGTVNDEPARMRFVTLARRKPAMAPTKSVGPKVPPTPPPALVYVMENTLRIRINAKKTGTSQGVLSMNARMVSPS